MLLGFLIAVMLLTTAIFKPQKYAAYLASCDYAVIMLSSNHSAMPLVWPPAYYAESLLSLNHSALPLVWPPAYYATNLLSLNYSAMPLVWPSFTRRLDLRYCLEDFLGQRMFSSKNLP